MFSGIISGQGQIADLINQQEKIRMTIKTPLAKKLAEQVGDSIAINGICLTVTSLTATEFKVDLMPETLRRTNLQQLKRGQKVNLEAALRPTTRIAGHFVLGHIDTTATVVERKMEQTALVLTFQLPNKYLPYVAEKGSVAVNGVSLTVTMTVQQNFSVSLIPLTQKMTNLGSLQMGDQVNIEVDVLSRYLLRQEAFKNEIK